MVEIHHNLFLNYVINSYFKIEKNLMLQFFICLKLDLLELFLNVYSLGVISFFFKL